MNTINFFTRETDLPVQNNTQAFGALSSSEYRVTSLFSGGNNPMAYAVTNGEIFIVEQTGNTNRVNLFLKPQTLFHGISVKYFVYRGLLKSDFLNGNELKPSSNDDSILIKNLRKAKNPEIALNLYDSLNDSFLIDDLFKEEEYQFALVKQGESIGRFDSEYGFEIMLDNPFFNPTLSIAKKAINIIEVSTNIQEVEASRLQILNYIDPAAYYGLFSHNAFSIGTNNTNAPKSVSKEGIYELVKKFETKNTVYLDIRDVYDNPIDWFESSPQNIKVTTNGSSALNSLETAYRNLNNYPIRTLTAGFSNPQTNEYGQKYFTLKLSLSTLNNSSPLLTLQTGYWERFASDMEDNMIFSTCEDNNGWTDDREFTIFSVNDSNAEMPVATYLQLTLSEYQDMTAIENQVPTGNTEISFDEKGLFAFI